MWSTNMQHFLDDKGSTDQTPVKAKELADHFGAIVAVVTLDFTGRTIEVSGIPCADLLNNRKMVKLNGVPGVIAYYDRTLKYLCTCLFMDRHGTF
jgi:hypothetical protein